jgi:prophage antirepressor-like protein
MTSPITPTNLNILNSNGKVGAYSVETFNGHKIASVIFNGERAFFPQDVALHMGYSEPRHLVGSMIDWAKSGELREGTHFFKLKGQALKDLKAVLYAANSATDPELTTDSEVSSTHPDYIVGKRACALTVLTSAGLRRVCNLCGTKTGVVLRDWLDAQPPMQKPKAVPMSPSIPNHEGHVTRAILTDLFDGKPVTSLHFGGERIFFPQEVAAHMGYGEPRYLMDGLVGWTKAGELREGVHFIKVKGQALQDLKATLRAAELSGDVSVAATETSPLSSIKPDANGEQPDNARSLISKNVGSLTVLTSAGLRRVCNLCGTKQGVMFRDWLDTVMDSLDKTGSYTLPNKSPNKSPDAPKAKRASLSPEEREERQRRADAKLLLKYLPELAQGAPHLSRESVQTVKVKALQDATGGRYSLGNFLPVLEEPRWHSPAQIAQDLGVSLARVGRAITAAGARLGVDLRADERYSRCILNQSQHGPKQVPSYIYNDAGRDIITQQLGLDDKTDDRRKLLADHPKALGTDKAQGSLLSPDRGATHDRGAPGPSGNPWGQREGATKHMLPRPHVQTHAGIKRGGVPVFTRGSKTLMVQARCDIDATFPVPPDDAVPFVTATVTGAWDMGAFATTAQPKPKHAESDLTVLEVEPQGEARVLVMSWGQARAMLGNFYPQDLGGFMVDQDCAQVVGDVLRGWPTDPTSRAVLIPLASLLEVWPTEAEGSARLLLHKRLAELLRDLARAEVF